MKVLLSLFFAFAMTVVSGAMAQDKITLGLSVDQLFESRVGVNNAIKAEAQQRGYELVELVADGDAQTQNQQIQSLITQGVDAILVCAVDQNTIERALIAAERAGIPVVAYDRDLPNSRVVAAFVGPDSLSDGRLAGAYTAEQLKDVAGEKVIVELIGALNDQNGIDRSKGFREELADLENVKLVEVPTDWDSARALSGAQNAFQANPEVHAVYAATDTHIPSVETVLTDLGKLAKVGEEGHVVITGVNGSNDGYQAVLNGTADGIVVMDLSATGQTAVDLATRLMNGESVDRVNVISGNFYTTDDIEANKATIWGAK
ncbi:sugar ABC transporter substrate-binding protein [Granulosicoccus antarcticus]|uniref:Ribose import binding protein RbsB n=1 Tax=Granulosicoccus antarcticus IMCC3135 TaxID=1192854 RepID=A0A2Z2P4D1_9GAMM|nr:sugar ABC transporter substrate-binding protein [Granulosicoccus antarcticus]ASJ76290.1 Ribose import binding protein RbsB [Granulosicoccus antarcticus IMCC3135]